MTYEPWLGPPPGTTPETEPPKRSFLRDRRVLTLGIGGVAVVAVAATAAAVALVDRGQSAPPAGSVPTSTAAPRSETGKPEPRPGAFSIATAGDCLDWPASNVAAARLVDCAGEHRFEVTEAIDTRVLPDNEFGDAAPPPTEERIQQLGIERCEAAARQYLGPKFLPISKFTISVLWAGERGWRQRGERTVLCGLQLAGVDGELEMIQGRVADLDQSRVWPAGTCLGIDPATKQPTDIPVDCTAPHSMEITGMVDVGATFPDALPPEADQDTVVKQACTEITDAYLAPLQLGETALMLIYSTVPPENWAAGSRRASCSVGAPRDDGGWSELLNGVKGNLLIDGDPPVPR